MEYTAPAYFSPSSLGTFNQCAKQFFFSRIQRLESFDTEHTIRGNFVHEVLELLLKADSEERTLDLAKALTRETWESEWKAKAATLGFTEQQLRDWRWSVWWCVENYFQMEDPVKVVPQGLEVKVEGTIEGVPFYGIVDRWSLADDGTIIVTDYKTGKVTKPQYAHPKKIQLYIYANLLEQLTGRECSTMQLYYVKDAVVVDYDPNDVKADALELFARSWDDMQTSCDTGNFATTTSPLCNWCDFRDICPEFN